MKQFFWRKRKAKISEHRNSDRRYFGQGYNRETKRTEEHRRLDRLMENYLDFDNGVFVEAGALDGITASNTLYFENYRGWTGLLIEPVPTYWELCARNRPTAIVENCALVSNDFASLEIELLTAVTPENASGEGRPFSMSSVRGAETHYGDFKSHVDQGLQIASLDNSTIKKLVVPTSTLDRLLRKHAIDHIDFFSLDVEGYELEVLRGLSLDTFLPRYILLECNVQTVKTQIDEYLIDYYEQVDQLSCHDFLYHAL
ncbi:MAG: FkbM family methyltransferase [Pirellulaceae bacterium]|nr:FkbM family methyltransferase [Pirellulaceae bacterium]